MKALPSQPVSIRLNTEEKAIYMAHGGAKLFKKWLRILEKKSKLKVSTSAPAKRKTSSGDIGNASSISG